MDWQNQEKGRLKNVCVQISAKRISQQMKREKQMFQRDVWGDSEQAEVLLLGEKLLLFQGCNALLAF